MARRYLPVAAFAGLIVAIQLATFFTGTAFHLTQLTMTAYYSLVIVGLCMLIGYAGQISLGHAGFFAIGGYVTAFLTTFNLTMLGRQMRACSANRDAARLCGIDAGNMVTLSFMVSAAIGALGGCIICPITYVQYDSGTPLAIKGFTVAILGGLGNSTAAVGAGMILGILESFSIMVLPTAYKEAISIAILLAILFVKPSGIFGSAEAARLKEF